MYLKTPIKKLHRIRHHYSNKLVTAKIIVSTTQRIGKYGHY